MPLHVAPRTVALLVATAVLVAAIPAAEARPTHVTFVVGFQTAPDAGGATYLDEDVVRADGALRFVVVNARAPAEFKARALRDPNVRYVQEDAHAYVSHATPNDPLYGDQYGWSRVRAPAAWDSTYGSSAVVVAVLDSGIDRTHADFDTARLLQGYDFASNDAVPEDDCGHGTHVTGTVGASTNNGRGVAGAAQVTILPVKVLRLSGSCSGSFSSIASGIRYAADQGAHIISMSFGCSGCTDTATSDALEYAWGKGVLLVASAGNSGPCMSCVGFPAKHPRVIAVGCTDATDSTCSFSSRGPEVELSAPGDLVLSTVPGNAYGKKSGTSMSAPHVSGAAALARSVAPGITNLALRNALATSAKDVGAVGRDGAFGYGLLDMKSLIDTVAAGTPAPPPPGPNTPPVASFAHNINALTLAVDGRGSFDPDGTVVAWSWNWGDGSAAGSGPQATHVYAAPGTYTVTLTVTDDRGATDTVSQSVTATAPPPAYVASIDGNVERLTRPWTRLEWRVAVATSGAPVAGAVVQARVTTPWGASTYAETTDAAGIATFRHAEKTEARGVTYTLCVSGVNAPGRAYDPSFDVETCEAIRVT